MTHLPLHQLVLYKNGIGYFVREGQLEGDTLKLAFQHDEINDVLKSLSVFDHAGGQVIGIHYETPVNALVKLANNSIRLSDADSLKTLLRDLRGRQIKAEFEVKEDKNESITGQLIGIDIEDEATRLSILRKDKRIRVYKLDDLRELSILDEQSESDLLDFLETNKSESDRRFINVQLSEGQHELQVSYVAPSPNWRVSYRVIADTEADESQGEAALIGWGLFDNHIEDLEDVQVTLVAGNPISFQYDLYTSNIPERERVKDQIKAKQGPVDYHGAPPKQQPAKPRAGRNRRDPLEERLAQYDESPNSLEEVELSMSFQDRVLSSTLSRAASIFGRGRIKPAKQFAMADRAYHERREAIPSADIVESVASSTEGKESGEVFQYIVTQPVSVKRGVSALVPIINHPKISYRRELLYNHKKVADHPVAALRMQNTTGFTLERGPVTVVENGDYKGEAVVPFTRDGAELYLPYAIEEGIQITHQAIPTNEEGGTYIRNVEMISERFFYIDSTYTIENNTNRAKTIRIEANKNKDYDLIDSPQPEEETAQFRRWSVTVNANSSHEFKIRERRLIERIEIIGGGCNPFARIMVWFMRMYRPLPDIRHRRNT